MSAIFPLTHGVVAQGGLMPPGPAWALYLMNEGSGQTLYDHSGNGRDCWLGDSGDPTTLDPAWAVVGGVPCLEFAGGQVCVPKTTVTLARPFTVLALARNSDDATSTRHLLHTVLGSSRGLMKTSAVTLNQGVALGSGYAFPVGSWRIAVGIANGTSSSIRLVDSATVSGDAGTDSAGRQNIGGRYASGSVTAGWSGQIGAVVVLAVAAGEALISQWVEYIRAVKGVS